VNWTDALRFFRRVKDAVPPSAEAGANAMAEKFRDGVKTELSRYPHPAHTRTPSPPGQPPGLISGALRDSVAATPAAPYGEATWVAHVGPHTVYAMIQEYGGVMHAHRPYMSWITDGRRFYAKTVELPERPYMRPVAERMSSDGRLTIAARDGVAEILYPAEGI
jgi:phage gpG-like protein